ncbi:uncharacterized protein LOC119662022 [Teleopsis dalmanni]|uniref:uncharacterized protein LOC119662022 n=1 Tax=Teleopsis dalmanni TaxID=139649 RepID=UPI000D32B568|nr:uncharacterized protein LOC119662022 [Teleopsis dalmanni]
MHQLKELYIFIALAIFLTSCNADERNPKKRQIYREEVLPHAGGRIPDTAFETDRLFLNRLQKEGISVPDGIVPEQRNPQVYPYQHKSSRTVYHIALSSDARYIPAEGRYHYQKDIPTVETTYLFPQIHGQNIDLMPTMPAYPVYKQFQLHNPLLNQVRLQPKKKAQLFNVSPTVQKARNNPYKVETYQNVNLLNIPVSPTYGKPMGKNNKQYLPNYGSAHLFNEFDDLFHELDISETSDRPANGYEKAKFYPSTKLVY